MDTLQVEYCMTEQEFKQLIAELTRRSKAGLRFSFGLGIILTSLAFLGVLFRSATFAQGMFPLSFGLVLLCVPLLVWRGHKTAFQRSGLATQTVQWKISAEKIQYHTDGEEVSYEWPRLLKVKETDANFFLYFQPEMPTLIPRRAFGSTTEIESFRKLVQQHNIKMSAGR